MTCHGTHTELSNVLAGAIATARNTTFVVINFLNERNEADRLVLELLTEKFSLFSGVFGASDEVLGTIESGVDFEKRILAIYQGCRTPEEIDAAFEALQ